MQQENIDILINLAMDAFTKGVQPGKYAEIAAHKAAYLAADKYHPEIADFAALAAATTLLLEVNEAILFSARVTDAATEKLSSESAYNAEWQKYSTTALPANLNQKHYFTSLTTTPDKVIHDFSECITPAYETVRVLDVVARNKAKRAALYTYRDTYATARSAYIRAMFIANSTTDPIKRIELFKHTITARLNTDLSYDRIDPSYFLRMMITTHIIVIASIILFLGIGAILLAAFHVTAIPIIPLACAGCGATVIGAGLLIGSFFARKTHQNIMEVNENRAETCTFM